MKDNKKSKVKASGLKSVIHLDDTKMVMANFEIDKPLEYDINASVPSEITDRQQVFDAEPAKQNKTSYEIKSKRTPPRDNNGQRTNGEWHNTTDSPDPLGLRPAILAKIFKNPDKIKDNLHIQVAQQILDFQKTFAVYANHLVYIFNNIAGVINTDKIGQGNFSDSEIKRASEYFKYLGITDINDFMKSVCVIKQTRHSIVHWNDRTKNCILNPENFCEELKTRMRGLLKNHLKNINDDFLKTNNRNLQILHLCGLGDNAQEFYNFTMRQDYKNLGFSIRILREKILEIIIANETKKSFINKLANFILRITNPDHKPISDVFEKERRRINKLLDFIIWIQTKSKKEDYQNTLRATLTDEEKDKFYSDKATVLERHLRSKIKKIISAINRKTIGNAEFTQPEYLSDNFHLFSAYVYYLTRFLDGKEINDLITTLIHKLDNIYSFMNIWDKLGKCPLNFQDDFALFKNAKKLADELRLINAFARMNKIRFDASKIKNNMKKSDFDKEFGAECLSHAMLILGKNDKEEAGDDWKLQYVALARFLVSNVCNSNAFQYLAKYANLATVRQFLQKNIVVFVLDRIERNTTNKKDKTKPNQAQKYRELLEVSTNEELAEKIIEINFNTFSGIKSLEKNASDADKTNQQKEREKCTQIMRLYFIVLYHIVKNLIIINSRYVMALWRLDFDGELLKLEKNIDPEKDKDKKIYMSEITIKYMDSIKNTDSKHTKNLKSNLTKFCPGGFKKYRNTIAHQNAIQFRTQNYNSFDFSGKEKLRSSTKNKDRKKNPSKQSYFALYHYMVQKCIDPNFQWNDYSKDLLKILNMPFAYNHARYNALSVEKRFDKNAEKEDKQKKADSNPNQ